MTLIERLRYRLRMLRLALTVKPIAGGAPDPDPDPDPAPGGGGDPDPDPAPDPDPGKGDPDPDPDPPKGGKDDFPWDDYNRLKRTVSDAEKAQKAEERKRAEAEGRYEDVLKSVEQEAEAAKAAKEEAELELAGFKNRIKVEKVASRLKFHRPDDAIRFISDEDAEGDEAHVERALKAAVKERPFLVNTGSPRSGASVGDDPAPGANGKTPIRTMEDVKELSPEEINERWDEVQKVMTGSAG